MKSFFNYSLIIVGTFCCLSYFLSKDSSLISISKDQLNTFGLAAMIGAMLITLGLLNIFTAFYIVDKSKK